LFTDFDLFNFFRSWLGWVVAIYCSIVTARWLWDLLGYVRSTDRTIAMVRRYVAVQLLRIRWRGFWYDLLICVLLTVAFFLLWHAQNVMDEIEAALRHFASVHASAAGARQ
jgi:hypothetical protein